MNKKVTNLTIKKMKGEGTPISMITAYDYVMAQNVDEAGIDMILVGDSLGNVVMGHTSTLPVTMDDMVHHTAAVVRGTKRALVVADMPFMSYQESVCQALHNAGRLMKETGCDAVKLEGGASVCEAVKAMTTAGISRRRPHRPYASVGPSARRLPRAGEKCRNGETLDSGSLWPWKKPVPLPSSWNASRRILPRKSRRP